MRDLVAVAALLAVFSVTAGCSDDDDSSSDPPTSSETPGSGQTSSPTEPSENPSKGAAFSPCDLLTEDDVVELAGIEAGDTLFSWQLARYGSTGADTCRIGSKSTAACAGCDFGSVEVGVYTGRPERTFEQLSSDYDVVDRPDVGDQAVLLDMGPLRYTLWTEVDDAIVFVYAQQSGAEQLRPDAVVELATRVIDNLPDDPTDAVATAEVLPAECEALDRAAIEDVLAGPVVLARGSVTEVGVTCDFQADNPDPSNANSPTPHQLGLHVEVRAVDDAAEFLTELANGEYGPADELPDLGQRAVFSPEQGEIRIQVDPTTLLTVEGFLAYAPDGHAPQEALVAVAQSALSLAG